MMYRYLSALIDNLRNVDMSISKDSYMALYDLICCSDVEDSLYKGELESLLRKMVTLTAVVDD